MTGFALLLACITMPAFAQGGMGGAVGGILLLVLGVIGIIAFLMLLIIWKMFGPIVTSIIVLAIVIKFVMWTNENANRDAAQHAENVAREQSVAQRCLSQGEEKFNIDLKGTEKIRFSISDKNHEQGSAWLDPKWLPTDFVLSTKEEDEKRDTDIDVMLTYEAGTIDIEVKHSRDGSTVAHRRDVRVDRDFCLGPKPTEGIVHFLRKALNRPDFYRQPQQNSIRTENPFHYIPVVATSAPPATGQFEKKALPEGHRPNNIDYSKLLAQLAQFPTCPTKDIESYRTVATCLGETADENKITLSSLSAVITLDNSWLTLSRVIKKNAALASLLVEQRNQQGKPLSAWVINFPLQSDSLDGNTDFTVSDISFEKKKMTLHINWKRNVSWSENYDRQLFEWLERRSTISAELPGVQ
ncbi:hypothetical protein [Undibacterium sp. TS12]|uniref:hypothetical protein n=1 Tax=Undibacterium sp. TS12 TaxID=2908202 RepID=UPI001F4CE891|nr:hypothetical protein [Undibacterium sp. TS12]MCH8622506.1 hypothetical protein [Undibacterium sp. TS12]